MKNKLYLAKVLCIKILFVFLVFNFTACALRQRVPVGVIPQAQPWPDHLKQDGAKTVVSYLQQYPIDNNPKYISRVSSILSRLFQGINSQEKWEVFVVKNPEFNALCAVGNYIVVYSGLLDQLPDDDQVAVVLAHEISHDLGRHPGNTGLKLLRALTLATAQVVAQNTYEKTGNEEQARKEAETIALLGQTLLVLPYSRDQEAEADQIGVFLMADAGFNPDKSVNVWLNKAKEHSSGSFDFFDTHPSHLNRAQELAKILPLAKEIYLKYDKSKNNQANKIQKNIKLIQRDNANKITNQKANNYIQQGLSQMQVSDLSGAKQNISSALQIEPKNIAALNGMAAVELRLGNVEKSLTTLKKASKIAPYNSTTLYNLACLNSVKGNTNEAFDYLKRSIEIDPALRDSALNDPDLTYIRLDPRFTSVISSTDAHPTFVINQF